MQRKKGVHYYNLETDACQIQRSNSYEQHVSVCKLVYANKFIMITFPEKLSVGILICVADKCM